MSALTAVAATVAATPTPSPEVIIKTVVPDWYNQLQTVLQQSANLGLLIIPGAVASKLHDFVNPKLGTWGNALLLFGYSIVLGVLGLVAAGSLNLATIDWHNPEVVGGAIFTVLGAASARYAAAKAKAQSAALMAPPVVAPQSTTDF